MEVGNYSGIKVVLGQKYILKMEASAPCHGYNGIMMKVRCPSGTI